jgi:hypothetical protein
MFRSVAEWWDHSSGRLSERERRILACRYPDRWCDRLTLEELGKELNVSRERVRQVQLRATEKLAESGPFSENIEEELWHRLSRGLGFVPFQSDRGEEPVEAQLSGLQRLFLEVYRGGLTAWLSQTSLHTNGVFHRSRLSEEEITRLTDALSQRCQGLTVQWIEEGVLDDANWRLAAAVSSELTSVGDYLCRTPLTDSRQRAIGAHEALVRQSTPTSLLRLWAMLREGGVTTGVQDVQRTVNADAYSNLFLDCGDYGYTAFGNFDVGCTKEQDAVTDYLSDLSPSLQAELLRSPKEQNEETIVGQLTAILAERGPLPSRDLIADFNERTDGRYAKSSAAALLVLFGPFTRMAPGCYGLPRHLISIDPVNEVTPFLLTEDDIHWYVTARSAGEVGNAFPLWTPAMEWEWVRWAQTHASADLFERLCRIVEPEFWPVSDPMRTRWRSEVATEITPGQGMALTDRIDVQSVDLRNLLAVAHVAKCYGSMNWVRANRVIGKRLDASAGIGAVGALMLLDVLHESSEWSGAQDTREGSFDVFKPLWCQLRRGGGVSWEDDEGQSLLIRVENRAQDSASPWLRENLSFKGAGPSAERAVPSDLDSLLDFLQDRRRGETRRRLLEELGEDPDV